ncbi:hypothetical protein BpHYR1_006637 [Brachionus plicatilis]|uniref:Uncharacterized protein n=1 Tax=Brachionus plicatilis TaxID=10195 RepID=A0A3M7SF01_BRAPC|nr:hypothetical protein BpHYR1_006637 [Brachionus plicatilis]
MACFLLQNAEFLQSLTQYSAYIITFSTTKILILSKADSDKMSLLFLTYSEGALARYRKQINKKKINS